MADARQPPPRDVRPSPPRDAGPSSSRDVRPSPPRDIQQSPPRSRRVSGWDAALVLVSAALTVIALARAMPARSGGAPTAPPATAVPSMAALPKGAPTHEPDTGAPISGCHFPDRGFGAWERWRTIDIPDLAPNDVRRLGKLLVPPGGGLREGGAFDLLVHFHGAEPVRKELAPLDLPLVVFAVDAGTRSSHYGRLLAEVGSFDRLLAAVEQQIASITGRADAHAAHVAVSSWSAGYAAVSRALVQAPKRVSALLLLDSLYAGYAPNQRDIAKGSLDAYVEAARRAARGELPFFLSHSGVKTDGYASTSEVATALLDGLEATSVAVSGDTEDDDDDGEPQHAALRLVRMYDAGRFVIRGYGGAGPDDHCAHLRLLKRALTEEVLPAFR